MNSPTANSNTLANLEDPRLPQFLAQQIYECGGNVELDGGGLWVLFVVEAADHETNALARSLLADVGFAHDAGVSADDRWTLYYVDSANRAAAVHWLQDLSALVAGEIRPVAAEHQALIRELAGSEIPHRVALHLGELHARGELSAGSINNPALIRTLLDQWQPQSSLFLLAFRTLLTHHLIDLVVLLDKMTSEDVDLLNEIFKDDRSRDPAVRVRLDAAAEIRRVLTRFHIINPLEQQTNNTITNPYAAYVDITCTGDRIMAPIDGAMRAMPRDRFTAAIRAVRRQLYRGEEFDRFDTLAPWMRDDIVYPFRYIKQRQAIRCGLAPMDWLYILERAM